MIVGIVPHRKLVSTRGSKVTIELPVLEYIADLLVDHYKSSTRYEPVKIKVIITKDESTTDAIAKIIAALDYVVDVVSPYTPGDLDVLFAPSGYTGDALKSAAKVIEY